MAESIDKTEIIATIISIITDMGSVLDDKSMQNDAHGIDIACMAHCTRNQLRELADKLRRSELEGSAEGVADKYRAGIGRAFDALCEASESLRQRMSDGEADTRETCALMQVTRAMLELLSLKVRG